MEFSHRAACDDARALALFDAEFIHGRGRTLSLAQRLPGVFGTTGATTWSARDGGECVSAFVTRPFDWLDAGATLRGAMVGLVCTRQDHRGRGLATRLLAMALEELRVQQVRFAVLWAGKPDVYERAGWQFADRGLLGRMTAAAPARDLARTDVDARSAWKALDAMRRASRLVRGEGDWSALLPPSTRSRIVAGHDCYAVIGELGRVGYLLDLDGEPAGMGGLVRSVAGDYDELLLNIPGNGPVHAALAPMPGIQWQAQRLAGWMALDDGIDAARFADWYLPFLDRI
jgi:predicted N-acetyltransferase YhbS